ncbi:hypothetical protein D3C81_959130 [compost metagenome]
MRSVGLSCPCDGVFGAFHGQQVGAPHDPRPDTCASDAPLAARQQKAVEYHIDRIRDEFRRKINRSRIVDRRRHAGGYCRRVSQEDTAHGVKEQSRLPRWLPARQCR